MHDLTKSLAETTKILKFNWNCMSLTMGNILIHGWQIATHWNSSLTKIVSSMLLGQSRNKFWRYGRDYYIEPCVLGTDNDFWTTKCDRKVLTSFISSITCINS